LDPTETERAEMAARVPSFGRVCASPVRDDAGPPNADDAPPWLVLAALASTVAPEVHSWL
jgi:hypothetical protein